MTGKDQDKSLDEYPSGKDSLSSLYGKSEQAEPTSAIDKAILDAAHNSVSRKSAATGPFSGSWIIPAALAAVLILAVGITMTLEKHPGSESYQAERYQSDKELSSNVQSPKQQAPVEQQQQIGNVPKETRSSAKPAAPAAMDNSEGKTTAPAKEGVMEAAPAAEPSQGVSDRLMIQKNEKLQSLEKKDGGTAATRWLQSIRELVKENKNDEAKKQLADFRRVYPNYPLPEDLKNLN